MKTKVCTQCGIEKSLNSKKDKIKPILQYDLEGNFIKEWESQTYASKKLNIKQSNLNKALVGNNKKYSGYIWKFKKEKIL